MTDFAIAFIILILSGLGDYVAHSLEQRELRQRRLA